MRLKNLVGKMAIRTAETIGGNKYMRAIQLRFHTAIISV